MASRRRVRRQASRRARVGHFRADGTPKNRFSTQADAERAALQARLEHGTTVGSYACAMCGGWHLGTRDGDSAS
jgi:hypothetical protein